MASEPNEPVTEAADTAIAAGENAEPPELAWSLDTEETSTHDHRWRGPVTSAGLVALVCVIVAVVTWFAITLYHQNDSRPAAPKPSAVAPAPKPVMAVHPEGGILNFVETTTIWTHDVSARPFIETAVSYFCPQYADRPVGGIGAPEAEVPTTTAAAPTTTAPVMTKTDQEFLSGLIGIGFPNPEARVI